MRKNYIVAAVVALVALLGAVGCSVEQTQYDPYATAAKEAGREPRPQSFVDSVAPLVCSADTERITGMLQAAVAQYDRQVVLDNAWHMTLVASHYCDDKPLNAFAAVVHSVGDTFGRYMVYTLPAN